MKSDRLHGLSNISLAAWQRVLCEELLNLRRKPRVTKEQVIMVDLDSCIFCEESLTAGLDQVGEEETGSVPGRKKSVKLDHIPARTTITSPSAAGSSP